MTRVRTALLFTAFLLHSVSPLLAQSGEFAMGDTTASFRVDWEESLLTVELERSVARNRANAPAAPAATQATLIREAGPMLVEAMLAVPWTSTDTVGEYVANDPTVVSLLYDAAANANVSDARTTPDLGRAIVVFEIDLHAVLTAALRPHAGAQQVDGVIGWRPSAEYTGILIYAADELPLFGTNRTAQVVPVVIPDLYYLDESGSAAFSLIEMSQLPRVTLESTGFAAYATDEQSVAVLSRVGERPLRLLARGVFGSYPADPILSHEDALEILSDDNNRALLREGRVVIVVPEESAQ